MSGLVQERIESGQDVAVLRMSAKCQTEAAIGQIDLAAGYLVPSMRYARNFAPLSRAVARFFHVSDL